MTYGVEYLIIQCVYSMFTLRERSYDIHQLSA
jgi:hypothetical protein